MVQASFLQKYRLRVINFAEYDYQTIDETFSLLAGSLELYELSFDAYLDGLAEELEGFVLFLEVIESELDPRDVGQVNLSRAVYLVTINQSGIARFSSNYLNNGHILSIY